MKAKLFAFIMTIISPALTAHADSIPMPHQIEFSSGLVKYPKEASQETLERYIPGLTCQNFMGDVLCIGETNAFSNMFIRGAKCSSAGEITFTLKGNKTVGALCGLEKASASELFEKYTSKYGEPRSTNDNINGMIVAHKEWVVGGELHTIIHYGGIDINGAALDKYSINIIRVADDKNLD